jgi:hypothetical protein
VGDSRFVRVLLKHTACGSDSRTRGTISTNLDGTKANSAMNQNRQQRRRSAAMARRNAYVENYVEHLPEVGPEALGEPGVRHVVVYHDDACRIFEGEACSCDPAVRVFAEPRRS